MNANQIAIFGGAFNPPTIGHVKLIEFLLLNGFSEVWMMPCYNHKYNKDLVDSDHRINMCNISIRNIGNAKVFDYEIRNKLDGSTYNLLQSLKNDNIYSDNIYFVMGVDNANTFYKWKNYEDLKNEANFVVVSRNGVNIDKDVTWYRHGQHKFYDARDFIPETSSTSIRNHFNDGLRPFPMLDDEVFKYIKKNKLYIKPLSREFLLNRGRCCKSGCTNCPY